MSHRDSRILPGIKSAEDWDSGDGYTGVRYRYEYVVREASSIMNAAIIKTPGLGLGQAVSQSMVLASTRFLTKLGEWITKEQRDLEGRGGGRENVWRLISHCIRTIWRELHKSRVAGRSPNTQNHPGWIIWAMLRAHKRMNEFVENGFSADPKLSHILNLHLQNNAVMKTSFLDLQKKIKDLEAAAAGAKKTADQAKSAADRVAKTTK